MPSSVHQEKGSPSPRSEAVDGALEAIILVVDDSALMRAMLGGYLRRAGFHNVLYAPDGEAGLRMAQAAPPDLVLTDLMMPRMDGFEFTRRLRADPRTGNIPVIVQTGMDLSDDRSGVYAAGASDLIIKPVEPRELISRVRVHLERHILLQERAGQRPTAAAAGVSAEPPDEVPAPMVRGFPELAASHGVTVTAHGGVEGGGRVVWGVDRLDPVRLRLYCAELPGDRDPDLQHLIRRHAGSGQGDAARWLAELNADLCRALPRGQHVSAFAAVIDIAARTVFSRSAAASPVLLGGASGRRLLDGGGFPLGVSPQATFSGHENAFAPGSALVLGSTGLFDLVGPATTTALLGAALWGDPGNAMPAGLPDAVVATLAEGLGRDAASWLRDDILLLTVQFLAG